MINLAVVLQHYSDIYKTIVFDLFNHPGLFQVRPGEFMKIFGAEHFNRWMLFLLTN